MLAGLRSGAKRWMQIMPSQSQPHIDLLRGWPNPGLLPPNRLKEASDAAFSDPEIWTPGLAYGPDDGYLPLRQELAKWLTSFYEPKEAIEIPRICVTGGASQNLACLLQTFTDAIYTRNVWMVAPTYYLACRIFDDAGFAGKIRGVPEDDQGVDIEFLSQQLRKSEAQAREEQNNEPVRSFDESRLKKLAECPWYNRNSNHLDLGGRSTVISYTLFHPSPIRLEK